MEDTVSPGIVLSILLSFEILDVSELPVFPDGYSQSSIKEYMWELFVVYCEAIFAENFFLKCLNVLCGCHRYLWWL